VSWAQTLDIYTQFEHPASNLSLENMKVELGQIMKPVGLNLEWHSLEEATGKGEASQILVVHFEGACAGNELEAAPVKAGPLGWTSVSDGEVLPFSYVDCDRIRNLMSTSLSATVPGEREYLLGRAMARVLAHEMYHVLTNSTRHASRGIAKSAYSSTELVSGHLVFEPQPHTRWFR
jgi:hypothetical protein